MNKKTKDPLIISLEAYKNGQIHLEGIIEDIQMLMQPSSQFSTPAQEGEQYLPMTDHDVKIASENYINTKHDVYPQSSFAAGVRYGEQKVIEYLERHSAQPTPLQQSANELIEEIERHKGAMQEQAQPAGYTRDQVLKLRNELFDSLPSGELSAFDLIKIIKSHIEKLDNLASISPAQDSGDAVRFGEFILKESILPRDTNWFDAGKHYTTTDLYNGPYKDHLKSL